MVGFVGMAVLAVAIAVDHGHWKSIAEAKVSSGNKRTLLQEVAQLHREQEDLRFELGLAEDAVGTGCGDDCTHPANMPGAGLELRVARDCA